PLLTLALLSPIWIGDVAYLIDDHWSTRPAIARAMSSLERGKMAVAMAGVLPYYSKWDAVDLWGLNTRALTRRHADPSWIATYDPDLIVIHNDEYAFPGEEREVRVERDWDQLCINAALAARSGGYEAVFVPTLDENRTIAAAKFLHRVRGSIARGRVWAGARVGIAEPRRTPRYDIYFIAPDYGDHLRLRELLESFGGTDTEGYRHRIADTAGG
ncbi:MAG: hypothetical protein KDA27_26525, partial [Candidatus Eisenbacteria bacterium]|nr:hypothetical protein [Candidatus Eisenbacteria bacterium]